MKMNFFFGKNNHNNNLILNNNENLYDKLDNIYDSIQNIVFNDSNNNQLNLNQIKNKNINKNLGSKNSKMENHDKKNDNIFDNCITKNFDCSEINQLLVNNRNNNYDNNYNIEGINHKNNINNLDINTKTLRMNMKENNKLNNEFSKEINNEINNIIFSKTNEITKKKNMNHTDKDIAKFYNSIKENSPNIYKINSSEKQLSQKEILRLKLEAFLIIKKYYLHRKAKSDWIKRKKKLIKISNNFYRNILFSKTFYGFSLNSKRKSLYNLIRNNYIDFRIKELSFNFIKILKFCYKEKNLENKAFFELTKNKLRRILNEIKRQMVYNKTFDKYLLTQILNNDYAVQFSKIIIYLGNTFNIKKLYRYENNINTIIHQEEFSLKLKCFLLLKNQNTIIENELNKKVEQFKKNNIILNEKKKFILQLEEEIIKCYKTKYFKEKIFFLRSKFYIRTKKQWRQKSAFFGPKKELINNFHNIELKKKCIKVLKNISNKRKQKIEYLQIKNFMKNVKFFYYQCRKKTIESLIIEGIRQKINKYNKLLVMKILLYSKIECLKLYRIKISTRKKYQKKLAFNLLKKNVFLKNYEFFCNIKFYFHYCFQIKRKIKKEQKKFDEIFFKQGMQKYVIHLIQIKIKQKKFLMKQKDKYINNLKNIRQSNFFKVVKNKIKEKKYNNTIYLKHAKIFSYAIGIMNLKNNCNVEVKLKSKIYLKNKIKFFFNLFKNRAITNYKFNTSKKILNKNLLKIYYNTFNKGIKQKLSNNKKLFLAYGIQKKILIKKYLEAINIAYKMDNIYNRIDEYYITKRKKCFLNILKKRYQDSIKYSMLSIRFNDYLIISTFNGFLRIINKNKNSKNINFTDNNISLK